MWQAGRVSTYWIMPLSGFINLARISVYNQVSGRVGGGREGGREDEGLGDGGSTEHHHHS